MKTITVKLPGRSYPIFIGVKLEDMGTYLKTLSVSRNVLIVTNPTVKKYYFSKIAAGLKKAGFNVNVSVIPDGEKYKTLQTVNNIYTGMLKAKLDRRSVVIALGGGVVGDVAGFAAATFLRGLPLIQVPTTLLAMVDSSVGGKTGVDLKEGKNLVGAFYQPKAVWIDVSTLNTLPRRQIGNGLAEVIKYGIIKDAAFFGYLERNIEKMLGQGKIKSDTYIHVIFVCCKIKAGVVEKDEFEAKSLREILNFGHTFGHALETLSGYSAMLHGEAVAVGMNFAASLAVKLGKSTEKEKSRLKNLILNAGLGACALKRFPASRIIDVMKRDKKTRDGKLRFVLPVKIGKAVVVSDIAEDVINCILNEK
jgi:3-dehydroquinate synthase